MAPWKLENRTVYDLLAQLFMFAVQFDQLLSLLRKRRSDKAERLSQ